MHLGRASALDQHVMKSKCGEYAIFYVFRLKIDGAEKDPPPVSQNSKQFLRNSMCPTMPVVINLPFFIFVEQNVSS